MGGLGFGVWAGTPDANYGSAPAICLFFVCANLPGLFLVFGGYIAGGLTWAEGVWIVCVVPPSCDDGAGGCFDDLRRSVFSPKTRFCPSTSCIVLHSCGKCNISSFMPNMLRPHFCFGPSSQPLPWRHNVDQFAQIIKLSKMSRQNQWPQNGAN